MTEHEKDQVLAVVKHYMNQQLRALVMTEAPEAYNSWCDRNVVKVVRVDDNTPVLVDVTR